MARLHYTKTGLLANGGFSVLELIQLEDGCDAVLRRLRASRMFCLGSIMRFSRGTKCRKELAGHKNIVSSIERGFKGIVPYEIIEFVNGSNLKKMMAERDPLLMENVASILLQCAEALAWVHRHGWIHLDVKPENFLVVKGEDGLPIVKLTDFDMVQPTGETKKRKQMGTPHYMAPEQFKHHKAVSATDVFSFSVMVYYLLTGQYPFPGETERDVRRKQVSSTFTPTRIIELNPDIPLGLCGLIEQGLEKKVKNRIATMTVMWNELKKVLGTNE